MDSVDSGVHAKLSHVAVKLVCLTFIVIYRLRLFLDLLRRFRYASHLPRNVRKGSRMPELDNNVVINRNRRVRLFNNRKRQRADSASRTEWVNHKPRDRSN